MAAPRTTAAKLAEIIGGQPVFIATLADAQQMEILATVFSIKKRKYYVGTRTHRLLWVLEVVGGYVALFCMSVYWTAYSNFAIELPVGNVGAVFSGWSLLAYAFVLQPTLEGTLAKGTARILGTAVGGLSAWLGCIVCSGSYDEFASLDPYAVVAWLAIGTCGFARR